MLTDHDVYLFREGSHAKLYERLGCHLSSDGKSAQFGLWAPNAQSVSVIGEWNGWDPQAQALTPRPDGSGVWEAKLAGLTRGQSYKYRIRSQVGGHVVDKADPFGFYAEHPPATGSRVWTLEYEWNDAEWMKTRAAKNALGSPMSIYELHPGSWRRKDGEFLTYRELAHALAEYMNWMGFTHVELM
ncbi:MAG: 1,4-alpha-glucan branching enzyme, partial [Burkholderiales bacterium]